MNYLGIIHSGFNLYQLISLKIIGHCPSIIVIAKKRWNSFVDIIMVQIIPLGHNLQSHETVFDGWSMNIILFDYCKEQYNCIE